MINPNGRNRLTADDFDFIVRVFGAKGNEGGSMEDNYVENAVDEAVGYLSSRRPSDKPCYLDIGSMETHGSQWSPDSKLARSSTSLGGWPVEKRSLIW